MCMPRPCMHTLRRARAACAANHCRRRPARRAARPGTPPAPPSLPHSGGMNLEELAEAIAAAERYPSLAGEVEQARALKQRWIKRAKAQVGSGKRACVCLCLWGAGQVILAL